MIELVILGWLAGRIPLPGYLVVPQNPPDSFFVVEKTGSSYENGIYRATVAVQAYGPGGTAQDGTLAAARLCGQISAAMQEADTLADIVSCTLYSDYRFPDTLRKRPRYQAVFDVVHY